MTLPQTHTRKRRTTLGLAFATILLGTTLTACGDDAGDTTCGELKEMSTGELIDFLKDAAEEEGGDDGDEALETVESIESGPEEQREAFADEVKKACDGESDDTKLDDLDGF